MLEFFYLHFVGLSLSFAFKIYWITFSRFVLQHLIYFSLPFLSKLDNCANEISANIIILCHIHVKEKFAVNCFCLFPVPLTDIKTHRQSYYFYVGKWFFFIQTKKYKVFALAINFMIYLSNDKLSELYWNFNYRAHSNI